MINTHIACLMCDKEIVIQHYVQMLKKIEFQCILLSVKKYILLRTIEVLYLFSCRITILIGYMKNYWRITDTVVCPRSMLWWTFSLRLKVNLYHTFSYLINYWNKFIVIMFSWKVDVKIADLNANWSEVILCEVATEVLKFCPIQGHIMCKYLEGVWSES
jgi:hypothetical protein